MKNNIMQVCGLRDKKLLILSVTFIVVLLFHSCSSTKNTTTVKSDFDELIENNWVLLNSNDVFKNYKGNPISFKVNPDNLSISGSSSCNGYSSMNNSISGTGDIQIGQIISTKKYCPDMSSENTYFSLLGKVNKYKIKNGQLDLYKDNLLLLSYLPGTE